MHQPYLGRLLGPVLEDNLKGSGKDTLTGEKDATGAVRLKMGEIGDSLLGNRQEHNIK